MKQKSRSIFITKLTHWEFWPFEIVYFPVFVYYFYLACRARSLFFFSASNPSIETGGMLGESKYAILKNIPEQYIAKTIFIPMDYGFENILNIIQENNIIFPLIAKPDIGERGTAVEKINSEVDLKMYVQNTKQDFLVQEYIHYPIELGIFYYRLPNENKGVVSSIVQKVFLKVIGNGTDSLGQLILSNPRASFQYKRLEHKFDYSIIPIDNETILLEPIGNHCRGTMFLDSNYIIDAKLTEVINTISLQIHGFYYGRYDLRCTSIEDLKQGKNIKILELNGAGAEPAHIYQPGFSIFTAWKVLLQHWSILFKVSVLNHKCGIPYMTFKEAKQFYTKMKLLK